MKKLKKVDYIYLGIIISAFLIMVLLLTRGTFLYGSRLDWGSQHIAFPEYFRTLFYSTGDLFPHFALLAKAGSNLIKPSRADASKPFMKNESGYCLRTTIPENPSSVIRRRQYWIILFREGMSSGL